MRNSELNISLKAQEGLAIPALKEEAQMLALLGVTAAATWVWHSREDTLSKEVHANRTPRLCAPGVLWNCGSSGQLKVMMGPRIELAFSDSKFSVSSRSQRKRLTPSMMLILFILMHLTRQG